MVVRGFTGFGDPYHRPSLVAIADSLNVDQVRSQRGGRWFASTVRYILNNPVYIGDADRPTIVSQELLERVQAQLRALPMGPAR